MTRHHPNAVTSNGTVVHTPTVKAPEMDPSYGLTAVILLAGIIAVIMGRR